MPRKPCERRARRTGAGSEAPRPGAVSADRTDSFRAQFCRVQREKRLASATSCGRTPTLGRQRVVSARSLARLGEPTPPRRLAGDSPRKAEREGGVAF